MKFIYWEKASDEIFWRLIADPTITFYIQPDGCFEFQQKEGIEYTWPHFCSESIDAMRETVLIWQADRKERIKNANKTPA